MGKILNIFKTIMNLFNLRRLYLIGLFFVIITIIFSNAIVESIEKKSVYPFFDDIGNRLVLTTKSLEVSSIKLVEMHNTVNNIGLIDLILIYSDLLSPLVMIILWLKLLSFIAGVTISDTAKVFQNYIIAIVLFFFIQIISLLIVESVNHTITGIMEGDNSLIKVLNIPFHSFLVFFKSLPYILIPIRNYIESKHYLNITMNLFE